MMVMSAAVLEHTLMSDNDALCVPIPIISCSILLPTHIFCLKLILKQPVSIRGVAITSDSDSNYSQVEGNNVAANFEDQRRRDGVNVKSCKEVNFDLEFPYGTGLSIIYTDPDDWQEEDVWYETKRTCEVRAGTNGKPMIKNDAPNGIRGNHWIR